jgi:hypothetical protein
VDLLDGEEVKFDRGKDVMKYRIDFNPKRMFKNNLKDTYNLVVMEVGMVADQCLTTTEGKRRPLHILKIIGK